MQTTNIRRVSIAALVATVLPLAFMGTANATSVQSESLSAPTLEETAEALAYLSIDPLTGLYDYDEVGALSNGISELLADEFVAGFETLTASQVTEVNRELGVPMAGIFKDNKAHCEKQYARDSARCRKLFPAQARAICWAAASARFANCLV